jgi:hypothetical protein
MYGIDIFGWIGCQEHRKMNKSDIANSELINLLGSEPFREGENIHVVRLRRTASL